MRAESPRRMFKNRGPGGGLEVWDFLCIFVVVKDSFVFKLWRLMVPAGIVAAAVLCAVAQDDDQADLRANPEIETGVESSLPDAAGYAERYGSLLDLSAAIPTITPDIRTDGDGNLTIVHIGDSHLQADMATARIRDIIADRIGSRGRGLILPFRAAGTNEPRDYVFSFSCPVEGRCMYMRRPPEFDLPAIGIGIRPCNDTFTIRIRSEEPFDSIAIQYTGLTLTATELLTGDDRIPGLFEADNLSPGILGIRLPEDENSVEITLHTSTPGRP